MDNEETNFILKTLDRIESVLGRMESDLNSDRSKFDDMIVRLDKLESRGLQTYQRLDRTEDKVHDAVEDIKDVVSDINEKVVIKK